MKLLLPCLLIIVCCIQCSKNTIGIPAPAGSATVQQKKFTEFLIPEGNHYAVREDSIVWLNIDSMTFDVIFDSSAVYTTRSVANQGDINKLYGFSDNAHHQTNSARMGWRWYNNELQLHAYVYKQQKRSSKLLKAVPFNTAVHCSIAIRGDEYVFMAGEDSVTMSRGPQQTTAAGYKLFPYFGGDETAPHDIRIRIKEW